MENELKKQKQDLFALFKDNQTDQKVRKEQQRLIKRGEDRTDLNKHQLNQISGEVRDTNMKLKEAKQKQQQYMKEIKSNHTKVLATDEQVKKVAELIKSEKDKKAVSKEEQLLQANDHMAQQIRVEVK